LTGQDLGESTGRDMGFEDAGIGSVIYMGRGSFRMEAVMVEPDSDGQLGIVQPVRPTVTAPLHTPPPERIADDEWRAPSVRSLFSSQVEVPRLAAPTGSVSLSVPAVALSRAMLVTLGGLVLLCGVVVGTAARHLLASPAPLVVAAAPAPLAIPTAPTVETVPPSPPPTVAVPAPITIRAHGKPLSRAVVPRPAPRVAVDPSTEAPPVPDEAPRPSRPWVDPWAE
jgi:hypothetical protein